jgi:enoyl-[acyl-carrier-protein] reductase (NADH)
MYFAVRYMLYDSDVLGRPFHDLFTGEKSIMQPEEIAKAIGYLASNLSSSVSGVLMPVDQGAAAAVF